MIISDDNKIKNHTGKLFTQGTSMREINSEAKIAAASRDYRSALSNETESHLSAY